jgi:hypothetical protein
MGKTFFGKIFTFFGKNIMPTTLFPFSFSLILPKKVKILPKKVYSKKYLKIPGKIYFS